MASLENGWHSNPLRVVALMTDTTPKERADACLAFPMSNTDVVWALMRQNQLMQDENRLLRKKLHSLQEENVWASSELDRLHWEHQTTLVEMQWLWNQRLQSSLPPPSQDGGTKTYAETLQTDEQSGGKLDGGERCIRHEPALRRERRQCKCCVVETIYRLMGSAPPDTPDLGDYVAASLANMSPFASFWCPGCTKDFVNRTSRREMEDILRLVGLIERDGASMAELKKRLKHASLRQRVKCAVHLKQ